MRKKSNCFRIARAFVTCALCCLSILPATLSARQNRRIAAGRDYPGIGNDILSRKPEHPYLLFDNRSKQAILDRVENDPEYAQIMDLLLQQGRRIMLNTTEPQKVFNDPASRYHQQPSWESYVGFYLSGAQLLAFLYQMTDDEACAQKAFRYADKLCELEGWAAGAHRFDIIYPRVWPYGAKDDEVVFSFDITTGDCALGLGLALVYDWIYPAMNKAQRDRIRGGLLENAILRVRGNWEYHWWASAEKCNWSAICYGGVGLAALSLLTEDPNLIDVVARSCEGFEKMTANYGDDNGWAEGRSYSFYGIRDAIAFPDAVKRLTDGKVDLFDTPGWKHPADFALFGLTGAFNDGAASGPVGFSYTYNKLVAESRDETAMYYLQTYLSGENRSRSMWELIWPRPTDVKAVKPAVASKYFPSIDWAFMRKDFDRGVQVAVKCAPADDPHHGHLDAGSFILTRHDDVIVGEVEQRFYDQFFFNDVRFDYLYVRSSGHNVVHVNDEEQFIAKRKDRPWIEGAGGKIDRFETTPACDYTVMDATKAYPGRHLKKWKRTIALDKENDIVLVLDRIACARGDKIDILFHPVADATVNSDGKTVGFVGKTRQTKMEMQPLVHSPFQLTRQTQYTVRVVKDDPVQAIPCLFLTLRAPSTETVVGTTFYPDELKGLNISLDESGRNPVIRYTVKGKMYAYEF
ncbi:MAG: heparinase II/III-family protein, partial [Tannerella sp.]|nr:heparinase II/III-family protein [Tannerella sp.]